MRTRTKIITLTASAALLLGSAVVAGAMPSDGDDAVRYQEQDREQVQVSENDVETPVRLQEREEAHVREMRTPEDAPTPEEAPQPHERVRTQVREQVQVREPADVTPPATPQQERFGQDDEATEPGGPGPGPAEGIEPDRDRLRDRDCDGDGDGPDQDRLHLQDQDQDQLQDGSGDGTQRRAADR